MHGNCICLEHEKKTPNRQQQLKSTTITHGLGYMYVSENAAFVYTSIFASNCHTCKYQMFDNAILKSDKKKALHFNTIIRVNVVLLIFFLIFADPTS